MKVICGSLVEEVFRKAKSFSKIRADFKTYLERRECCFDKFTITQNDSMLGFISEYILLDYIRRNYENAGLTAVSWESQFDMRRVIDIVGNDSKRDEDVQYVRKYFYDAYDICLSYKGYKCYVDIKTA